MKFCLLFYLFHLSFLSPGEFTTQPQQTEAAARADQSKAGRAEAETAAGGGGGWGWGAHTGPLPHPSLMASHPTPLPDVSPLPPLLT